jgi:peptidyl-tRNA hydrolase
VTVRGGAVGLRGVGSAAVTRDPDPFVMYIIVRRSLKLSAGKVGSQCGHAVEYLMAEALPDRHPPLEEIDLRSKAHLHPESMTEVDRARFAAIEEANHARYERGTHFEEWRKTDGTKIVLGASDEEFAKVQEENPVHFPVVDLGYTQVAPNTKTAIGLWPMRKSWASSTVRSLRPL